MSARLYVHADGLAHPPQCAIAKPPQEARPALRPIEAAVHRGFAEAERFRRRAGVAGLFDRPKRAIQVSPSRVVERSTGSAVPAAKIERIVSCGWIRIEGFRPVQASRPASKQAALRRKGK